MNYKQHLENARNYIQNYFENNRIGRLFYHNLIHTELVVSRASEIAVHYNLAERECFIVNVAAWFHDLGYGNGANEHEMKSAEYAIEFLKREGVADYIINEVQGCILATKMPQEPTNLIQQIVCDADLYHLGTDDFGEINKLLRKEAEQTTGSTIEKDEWRKSTIKLLQAHFYHTDYCRELLSKQKQKNLSKLLAKNAENAIPEGIINQDVPQIVEPLETKKQKADRPEKGIETMFRITSGNSQRLSDMADNKANIMITTTSIIMSVLLSVLIRRLEDNPYLVIPTTMLLLVCIVTMVFSILATRPKLPQGTFSQQELDNKSVNMLFFGNFYRMPYSDYSHGMRKMMNDKEFLYDSLTRDVYYQGVAIGRKYQLLRIAYNVFMFGIVLSVISFVISSILFGH